jgi:hypothetical protein
MVQNALIHDALVLSSKGQSPVGPESRCGWRLNPASRTHLRPPSPIPRATVGRRCRVASAGALRDTAAPSAVASQARAAERHLQTSRADVDIVRAITKPNEHARDRDRCAPAIDRVNSLPELMFVRSSSALARRGDRLAILAVHVQHTIRSASWVVDPACSGDTRRRSARRRWRD